MPYWLVQKAKLNCSPLSVSLSTVGISFSNYRSVHPAYDDDEDDDDDDDYQEEWILGDEGNYHLHVLFVFQQSL